MLATRFIAGSEKEAPASLYYAEGSAFQRSAHAAAADDAAAGASDAYDGRGFDAKEEPCSPANNAVTARHTAVTGEVRRSACQQLKQRRRLALVAWLACLQHAP